MTKRMPDIIGAALCFIVSLLCSWPSFALKKTQIRIDGLLNL